MTHSSACMTFPRWTCSLRNTVSTTEIGVPRVTIENGSKIVFTTRSKDVGIYMEAQESMQVVCLSLNYAWELFQKEVGETTLKSHEDIPLLAKEVAEMRYGLPLALCVNVSLAEPWHVKRLQEWRHAIEVLNSSIRKFPGIKAKILPILMFSYDGLKDEKLKLCFLYYSLFPENYTMKKDDLIEYWICEELIDRNRDEYGVNNHGHDIIGSLVRAHLLMNHKVPSYVKMHDVIREMALWIMSNFGKQEEPLSVKIDTQSSELHRVLARGISLMNTQIYWSCTKLSTLLLKRKDLVSITGETFLRMPTLVVLDLSENESLSGLPQEISSLGSLRYLNLYKTGVKALPVGLKELMKLIYLNLESTNIQSIAGILESFPNLQVLKLCYSSIYVDDTLLKELQLLEHLKILTIAITDAQILERIQGVSQLAISIQVLALYEISAPHVSLNPAALSGLQRFDILSCKVSKIKIVDWGSKERGKSSPCFKQLSIVNIHNVEGPTHLTWLLFAQNLIQLQVNYSSSIENIKIGIKQ